MKIFINYRRDDEANIAFVIANALMREYGVSNVFFDRQAIKAGSEFPQEIDNALENCRIFIPVIGREWLNIMNKRRTFEEDDYVLNEIEHALEKGVIVLPILVDDTSMPSKKDLPPKLSKLSIINAVNISSDPKRLPLDIKLLITELNDIFSRLPKRSNKQNEEGFKIPDLKKYGWILGSIISVIVIAIFAVIYFKGDNIEQKTAEPEKEQRESPKSKKEIKNLQENQVADIDGNIYTTVIIGDQVWMAENLKVTHYRNGDPIEKISDSLQWINLKTGAYCSYENNDSNSETYGYLYNWFVISDKRSICPEGWHIPSKEELEILRINSGGHAVAGGKLKENGFTHWKAPNEGADNSTGFSALPGGMRSKYGKFYYLRTRCRIWSSTEFGSWEEYWNLLLMHTENSAVLFSGDKPICGFSIRCLKD